MSGAADAAAPSADDSPVAEIAGSPGRNEPWAKSTIVRSRKQVPAIAVIIAGSAVPARALAAALQALNGRRDGGGGRPENVSDLRLRCAGSDQETNELLLAERRFQLGRFQPVSANGGWLGGVVAATSLGLLTGSPSAAGEAFGGAAVLGLIDGYGLGLVCSGLGVFERTLQAQAT